MTLDPSYLDAIKRFEGFAPTATWDYKQNTNGYGTRALYPGETIDHETAEQRFQTEIAKAAAHVDSVAPNAPPGAREALVSLTFNAGPGWSSSGLGQLVSAGDWQGVSQRLQEYNKAGGQVNPGLVKRRAVEASWFNAPPIGGAPAPVPALSQGASSYGGVPNYGQAQNNAPAASPVAPRSQPGPAFDLGQPEQAPTAPMLPMLGLPRRPPDFSRLMAMLQQARSTHRA